VRISVTRRLHLALRFAIGLVWFINGLVCKVLGLVPRHEEIVATVLGNAHAHEITVAIGLGEVALALWVWSGRWPRTVAAVQITLVVAMNLLEFFLAPELLLWGRLNAFFAGLFAFVVFYDGFILTRQLDRAE
jgi:hypothetical protein